MFRGLPRLLAAGSALSVTGIALQSSSAGDSHSASLSTGLEGAHSKHGCMRSHERRVAARSTGDRKFAEEAYSLLERTRIESGSPGITAAIYATRRGPSSSPTASPAPGDGGNGDTADSLLLGAGRVVWEGATGLADLESGLLMQPGMRMRIASISKSLTAVLCARLIDVGVMDPAQLDIPLGDVDSGSPVPAYWAAEAAALLEEERSGRGLFANDLRFSVARALPASPELVGKAADEGPSKGGLLSSVAAELSIASSPGAIAPFPAQWRAVTLRQLLSHTAGVRGYKGDEFESCVPFASTLAATLPFIHEKPLGPPQGQYAYTTHGYTLASLAIEAFVNAGLHAPNAKPTVHALSALPAPAGSARLSFTEAVRSFVLAPLRLDATLPEPAPGSALVYDRASQHVRKGTKLTPAPPVNLTAKYSGGGYLSTALDLARFGGSLVGARPAAAPRSVLDIFWTRQFVNRPAAAASLASSSSSASPASPASSSSAPTAFALRSSTPSSTSSPVEIKYGLGWDILDPSPDFVGPLVGHSGGAVGGSSYLLVLPDEGLAVAVLANQNDCALRGLATSLAKLHKRRRDAPCG